MSPKIANGVNGGLKSRILRSNFLFSLATRYLGDPILNITEPPVLLFELQMQRVNAAIQGKILSFATVFFSSLLIRPKNKSTILELQEA